MNSTNNDCELPANYAEKSGIHFRKGSLSLHNWSALADRADGLKNIFLVGGGAVMIKLIGVD